LSPSRGEIQDTDARSRAFRAAILEVTGAKDGDKAAKGTPRKSPGCLS
jgi:hypothetical protein